MHAAALTLSVLLAIAMLMSGTLKIVRAPRIVRLMADVHVSGSKLTVLGGLQVAAAVGLVVGIWIPALGTAAAVGLVLYFSGAIAAHLRASDPNMQGAAMFLALSIATLVLLFLDV